MAVFKSNNSGHPLDSIRASRHLSIICSCRFLNHNLDLYPTLVDAFLRVRGGDPDGLHLDAHEAHGYAVTDADLPIVAFPCPLCKQVGCNGQTSKLGHSPSGHCVLLT